MAESFRFSPRPNRAAEVSWRAWGRDAFEEAARREQPVLLNLTAVWCHWCHVMDETTYSDAEVIRLINDEIVPVRVDADRNPHVQDRYIAGGWPTNAFLTPTGEVLWAGTYVPPEQFRAVAESVLGAWRTRRGELQSEIERRRKALEAARARHPAVGLVRREAADDVLSMAQESFDARNGGFGDAPKFPAPDLVELLFVQGERTNNSDWLEMADRTLDGMLAGEVFDDVEGGFFRYATLADWTQPHYEKMLSGNAGLLRAYALGARLRSREDWRRTAERTVEWVERTLHLPDGGWGGSQDADEGYYRAPKARRSAAAAPPVDATLYTNWNAQWIHALAAAGGRLGHETWTQQAERELVALLASMAAPDDLLHHYRPARGAPALPGLLVDALDAASACLAAAQSSGKPEFIKEARRIVGGMEGALWAEDGGFADHVKGDDVGALRYRDRPFEANAIAARVLHDLALATGERSYRAVAERILALLSPLAGRYGVAGAVFALAVEEFFEPPLQVLIVGEPDETAALRRAALQLAEPNLRVWPAAPGARLGSVTLKQDAPAAYVCRQRTCSAPVRTAAELTQAVASTR